MDALTRRRRGLLYACALLMDFGAFSGYAMIFLLLKDHLGASLTRQGLLALAQLVLYVVLCPTFSRLARRRSRRLHFLVVGPLVLALGYLLISRSSEWWQVGLAMWLSATGAALYWPQLEAEIGHGTSAALLSQRMGLFNLSWSIGSTPAPFVGALLYVAHPRLPFLGAAAAGVAIAALLALYRMLCHRAGERIEMPAPLHPEREPNRPVLAPMPTLLVGFIWLAWVGNFVAQANQSISRTLFQNLGRELHYTAPQIGWIMALLGITRTGAFVVLQVWRGWVYRSRYLFALQGVMVVGVALLCVSGPAPQAALAMGLVGIGAAMAYAASMFYSVEGAHYGKASAGLHEAVLGGGGALGLLLAGQVAPWLTHADPRSPFYGSLILTALCFTLQGWFYARHRRRTLAAVAPAE